MLHSLNKPRPGINTTWYISITKVYFARMIIVVNILSGFKASMNLVESLIFYLILIDIK